MSAVQFCRCRRELGGPAGHAVEHDEEACMFVHYNIFLTLAVRMWMLRNHFVDSWASCKQNRGWSRIYSASSQFAQCVGGSWFATACAGSTQCYALPLVNKQGTSITCDTEYDAAKRIANITGAMGRNLISYD